MKCKIFTATSLQTLEALLNEYLQYVPEDSYMETRFVHEPQYESASYNASESWTVLIIEKGKP
ncbi:MAG TPA: hypothetical protein VL854_04955 [Nitrososphaeraceae archaeon]|nr:hypothetical protein [Nitrososphaeraceae archaeon]